MVTNIVVSTVKIPDTIFSVDLLRLDLIHNTISGNKYFKLKNNLLEAHKKGYKKIITVGGNYSNHLHATAYACMQNNLECVLLVTNKNNNTPTLNDCKSWNANIETITKQLIQNDEALKKYVAENFTDFYYIPMGGDNDLGIIGASEIANYFDKKKYDKIICAVGTGTTLNGIAQKVDAKKLLGIAAVKDLSLKEKYDYNINFDYTFGGFAKHNNELIEFMQNFYAINKIELDFVYTAKMLWGVKDLYEKNILTDTQKTLCIHTGGLQGNRSINVY